MGRREENYQKTRVSEIQSQSEWMGRDEDRDEGQSQGHRMNGTESELCVQRTQELGGFGTCSQLHY